MPWEVSTIMSSRQQFVSLAESPARGESLAALCRRFKISRKTGYKWLERHRAIGSPVSLEDLPRRPRSSPAMTPGHIAALVVQARELHPAWGARKLAAWLERGGLECTPSPSTITRILHRHGLVDPEASRAATPFVRFERARPNELWQMDFKGHVPMVRGGRCHPLAVLDDHSRYALSLRACDNEREQTVIGHLIALFRLFGLPERILCDNGSPWGSAGERAEHTALSVWLLKLGVGVSHGRPMHPQTQGKLERFNRTLKAELLSRLDLLDLSHAQRAMDRWRDEYNIERPHEALDNASPVSRYTPSVRAYPERVSEPEYSPEDRVRRVYEGGIISYLGQQVRVGKAFTGERVAVRSTRHDGVVDVCLGPHRIGQLNLHAAPRSPRRRASLATLARPADAGSSPSPMP
jgi:transposase InsO family protein